MDKEKKYLIIVLLVGLIGVSNLGAGILASLYIAEMNLPERISVINSMIGSFDSSMIRTFELQTSISNMQDLVVEELTSIMGYSQILGLVPVFFMVNGVLFILLSAVLYFWLLEKTAPIN